jgi:hypothetical protein
MSARAAILTAAAALLAAAAVAGAAPRQRPGPGFAIAGRPVGTLAPGRALPIDVGLSNRRPYPLRISRITVAVRSVSGRGCAAGANFRAVPYRGRPIRLAPWATRTLAGIGIRRALWPRVAMLDTRVSQDACAGARLVLRYAGSARRAR